LRGGINDGEKKSKANFNERPARGLLSPAENGWNQYNNPHDWKNDGKKTRLTFEGVHLNETKDAKELKREGGTRVSKAHLFSSCLPDALKKKDSALKKKTVWGEGGSGWYSHNSPSWGEKNK